ncbi:MAG: mercuric reductase [Myxococcales bacterium]|nr:mercuric reductase [Myxococcales bacterium]
MTALPEVSPLDEFNRTLIQNVHPRDWKNPVPTGRYNLVVIGAGSAGLITSAIAAGLGAKVALVERHFLGGDCLNVGCVPSKGLIRASRLIAESRRAAELGVTAPSGEQIDFAAAMRHMRRVRARISAEDAATRYRDELGVDVYLGEASFTGEGSAVVDGTVLEFAKAVIASGARAVAPPIPGLAEAGFLDNETLFNLTERPRRLGVIGGGPMGCEMAQAFRRLGSEVVLFDVAEHILVREDADAAEIVQKRFLEEGVQLALRSQLERVEVRGAEKVIHLEDADGNRREVGVDEILVAVGRAANVEGLDLEAAGVAYAPGKGVGVNDYLQTSNPRIYAAGDICMEWKFTHAADAAAKIVVQNALFYRSKKLSDLVMPWCTYTDPEIAHVGLYPHEAAEQGLEIDSFEVPLESVNRAVADGEEEGFVKIHTKQGTDQILGATIVAAHAGDLISQVTLAIVGKVGLGKIGDVIFPYPTQAEGIKRAAGAYTRTRLTPFAKRLVDRWMAWRR